MFLREHFFSKFITCGNPESGSKFNVFRCTTLLITQSFSPCPPLEGFEYVGLHGLSSLAQSRVRRSSPSQRGLICTKTMFKGDPASASGDSSKQRWCLKGDSAPVSGDSTVQRRCLKKIRPQPTGTHINKDDVWKEIRPQPAGTQLYKDNVKRRSGLSQRGLICTKRMFKRRSGLSQPGLICTNTMLKRRSGPSQRGLICTSVSEPFCFGAASAPGILYGKLSRLRLPIKRDHNFGIF